MDKTHTMAHGSGTVTHKIGTAGSLAMLAVGAVGYGLNVWKLTALASGGAGAMEITEAVVRAFGILLPWVGAVVGYL